MAEAGTVGFFGKAPAFGDFLTRGLPTPVQAAWDGWLQSLVRLSREELGSAWREAWLSAPVWHFSVGRFVLDDAAWCGVLIPSVDRVGRWFPFTILGAAAAGGAPLPDWLAGVEALALSALEDGFSSDTLQAALRKLPAPGCLAATRAALAAGGEWLQDDSTEEEGGSDWPAASVQALAGCADHGSVWWRRATDRVPAGRLHSAGLPAPGCFNRLLGVC